ncbi:hypothetical protein [Chelativorans sp. M5D2P16]|uniref:hypothetical protein n=1 Tax=Chelativorans sp. M5D2P16 TaxID=3095678 RepID=UPI002AC9F7E3|nr:hypothetical protein [Chelativorans sp. M5D2P16]MDZ5697913.1 hypothetical protein [Chelativorans sp. M5D2P16]
MLAGLLLDLFDIRARAVTINRDRYSLNSLNGFFETDDGAFFFKFHQEEGEEAMSGEYYRADILAEAGLPVDQPLYKSVLPGEQILIYRRRQDPRFSDVLRALDLAPDEAVEREAVSAERDLSERLLAVYRATLHPVTVDEVRAEPIHRLFYERLIDPETGALPGGRYKSFYVGKTFRFPGVELDWDHFREARFVINGRRYEHSVGALFTAAARRLDPARLADAGGITAHGDAHNANVWYERGKDGARLAFFDPAFAGADIPTLLAEVKATFHNVFAHPLWLYDPAEATQRFHAAARYADGTLFIETDWKPTRVRHALLDVKARHLWRPLLQTLKEREMLPADWRDVLRLGLFLCPTLVMKLRAGSGTHTPVSSLIAFSMAVMAGSPPREGEDLVTQFLDAIDPDKPAPAAPA